MRLHYFCVSCAVVPKTLVVRMVHTGVWCFLAIASQHASTLYNHNWLICIMVLCCQMLANSVLLLFYTIPFVRVVDYVYSMTVD